MFWLCCNVGYAITIENLVEEQSTKSPEDIAFIEILSIVFSCIMIFKLVIALLTSCWFEPCFGWCSPCFVNYDSELKEAKSIAKLTEEQKQKDEANVKAIVRYMEHAKQKD